MEQPEQKRDLFEEIDSQSVIMMANEFYVKLSENDSYSQTINIGLNGKMEPGSEAATETFFATSLNGRPAKDIYLLAKKVKDLFPEYNFSFDEDRHGEWIRYTVTKNQ